ncbi:MAG: hypothetical protein ACE37F_03910 [Nannocystaceae bacterium]|nr:hypothetical protein [bacterium]
MSLLRTCVFLLPSSLALACAGNPSPVVEAPQCEPEPTIVVSDPTPSKPIVAIPPDTEFVKLRLFVVGAADSLDETLPEPIQRTDACARAGCDLLLSPVLLGRNHAEMEIEIGSKSDGVLFSMEARPRILDDTVELRLDAHFLVEDTHNRPQHLQFSGALTPGQITHVGTFYATDHRGHVMGPQVYAVVERATGS